MAKHAKAPARSAHKIGVLSLGSLSVAAALCGLSAGTAHAEIKEEAPTPVVSSRQASDYSVVRINDMGVAGGIAEAELAKAGVVSATGSTTTEVRDSVKAVAGSKAKGYEGSYPVGPPIGDF